MSASYLQTLLQRQTQHLSESEKFNKALYNFKSAFRHYVLTGQGKPEELTAFPRENKKYLAQYLGISSSQIYYLLNAMWIQEVAGLSSPAHSAAIDTEILKTAIDWFKNLDTEMGDLLPNLKKTVLNRLLLENFNFYDNFGKTTIFGNLNDTFAIANAYIGFCHTIEFVNTYPPELIETPRLLGAFVNFLKQQAPLFDVSEVEKLETMAQHKEEMLELTQLFTEQFVLPRGLLNEFKLVLGKSYNEDLPYKGEIDQYIEKSLLNFHTPQTTAERPAFKI